MAYKKYNIAKAQNYTKDGVEKTFWANVGTLTEIEKQDGTISRIVEIPAIGLKANAFPIERKDNPERPASFPRQAAAEDVNQDDTGIPF